MGWTTQGYSRTYVTAAAIALFVVAPSLAAQRSASSQNGTTQSVEYPLVARVPAIWRSEGAPWATTSERGYAFPADSAKGRDKSLWVFAGAVVGGAVGLVIYKRDLDKLNDADFAPGPAIPIYVGSGAAIGGPLAFLLASVRD